MHILNKRIIAESLIERRISYGSQLFGKAIRVGLERSRSDEPSVLVEDAELVKWIAEMGIAKPAGIVPVEVRSSGMDL